MNLKITRVETPANKYAIKCPYPMTPTCIVIHNTANDASAANEISYMLSNNDQISFHFAVDDIQAVQGLPLDRNGWHAGDGANGTGNRYGIGIEVCYSKSGGPRHDKAKENAALLTAKLLLDYGWDISKVTKHQDYSKKYCPHRILDEGWDKFLSMVQARMAALSSAQQPAQGVQKGDRVLFTGGQVYASSTAQSASGTKAESECEVTAVAPGAQHPYHLVSRDGVGVYGWVDAANVTDIPIEPEAPADDTDDPHKRIIQLERDLAVSREAADIWERTATEAQDKYDTLRDNIYNLVK